MVLALPALGSLVLVLWVIATAAAITDVMLYVSGVLHGLPFPINQLAGPVESLAQGISNVCGKVESKIDGWIGACWHLFAHYLELTLQNFEGQALLLLRAAEGIGQLSTVVSAVRTLVHSTAAQHTGTAARVKTLEREYKGIEAQVKQLEREFKGIDDTGVRKKLDHLGREVATIKNQTIPAIENTAEGALNDVIPLGGLFGISFPIPSRTTLATVGAGILTALGLNWLRCDSNPFNGNKNACNLWSTLAKFLPSLAFLAIAFDFSDFVKAAEVVAGGIGTAVGDIEGTFALELPPLPPPGT